MRPNVMTGPIVVGSIQPCNLHSCTKEEILEYFENGYSLNEWIFTSIKEEKYFYKTPDRLRMPLIFYYCHTAVVFVNKMLLAGLLTERVDVEFEALFETGVDEMSWDDVENYRMGGSFKWPPLEEARAYRLKVRELVRRTILDTTLVLPITQNSKWWGIFMGMEHERIHLETSSVLIRQLPVEMVERPQGWAYAPLSLAQPLSENPMVHAGDAIVTLGKNADSNTWGWSNEYGSRKLRVSKFAASKFLITNGEYLEFVKSGGYENKAFWSEEGWTWKSFRKARHPTFWVCSQRCKSGCGNNLAAYSHCMSDTDGFRLRLMFDVISLPHDWPVEVNYLEAKAYCAWRGPNFRLPTEAEHHVMRTSLRNDSASSTVNGTGETKHNLDLCYGSPTPVNMFPPSDAGFCDVFGNVWEWVEDHFNGLPGEEVHFLYSDFSDPCYDGKHTMIMGGSWVSSGDEASPYARFSFRRHFFQHLGFRVAKTEDHNDATPVIYVKTNIYVSGHGEDKNDIDIEQAKKVGLKPILTESTSRALCDDTTKNLIKLIKVQYCSDLSICTLPLQKPGAGTMERALVVGCGPGRIAFELTSTYDEVIGCDISGRCIDFATKLADEKSVQMPANGLRQNGKVADGLISLHNVCDPTKVIFKQLTWLPVELGKFDLVVFDGLERLTNKKAWLAMTPHITRTPGSTVIVLSQDNEVKEILNDVMSIAAKIHYNILYQ